MGRSKKSRRQRRLAHAQAEQFEKSLNNPPRSMIFRRGIVGDNVKKLIRDMRAVMSPFTAKKLRESKDNTIRDFLKIAGPFHVTHFMVFSQGSSGVNFKISRIPRGPSLHFRLNEYSTMESVRNSQKEPANVGTVEYNHAPLVVLNNFSGSEDHKKIMAAIFQNMFPGLDITSMRLNECRRVVLINYNEADDTIDFRHYLITAVPVGLTKGVRKIIKGKLVDLHNREDIADYIENPNTLSDSEAELGEDVRVQLAQRIQGRGNIKSGTSAIKLKELGPRMKLQLVKIEEGLFDGTVLYHKFVKKTEQEVKELAERKMREKAEKEARKLQQEANVLKKQKEAEEAAKAKAEKQAKKLAAKALLAQQNAEDNEGQQQSGSDDDEDDSSSDDDNDNSSNNEVEIDDEDDDEPQNDNEFDNSNDDDDDEDNEEGGFAYDEDSEVDDDEEEASASESESSSAEEQPPVKKSRGNKK